MRKKPLLFSLLPGYASSTGNTTGDGWVSLARRICLQASWI